MSKTGWKVRQDRTTKKWEAYRNTHGPEYREFASARRAWKWVRTATRAEYSPIAYTPVDPQEDYTLLRGVYESDELIHIDGLG